LNKATKGISELILTNNISKHVSLGNYISLGSDQRNNSFRDKNLSKLPKVALNRHFPAKSTKPLNRNISVASKRFIMPLVEINTANQEEHWPPSWNGNT